MVYLLALLLRFHPTTGSPRCCLEPEGIRRDLRKRNGPERQPAPAGRRRARALRHLAGYNCNVIRKGHFLVSFSVKIRQQDHVVLVDVAGHLTFFEVRALRDSVQSLLREKRSNILLNLSQLQYLDSSGIGELARIYVAVVKQGGAMKVVGLAPKVEEILKVTHLSQVFQEFPDEQTALRSFTP